MESTVFNFREAYERLDVIKARLGEMATALEGDKEREGFTPAEEGERKQLFREMDILECKIKAHTPTGAAAVLDSRAAVADANRRLREAIARGERFEMKLRAVSSTFGGNASGYAAPAGTTNPDVVSVGDIVEPLFNQTILATIGSPLLTGLKGNHYWPVVEAFSATVNDEGVALGDTKIPLSKLYAKPERIGIAVPITREALNETDGLIESIAREYIPNAVAELMNEIMFKGSKVTGATNLYGPFIPANIASSRKLTYAKNGTPSLSDLLALKASVLKTNVRPEGLCYVMSESTKAVLEATPKWSGAAAAVVDDNGRVNGVPVYTTSHVDDGTVLFGAFKYAPQGLFGDMTLIVDPYTQARKNAVDFVLNVNYAISVLRQEAFAILTEANS